jgi:hypothetical protein
MRHHIVYWRMAKREADVDDAELALLREQERRGEVYIEFLDEMRLPLTWSPAGHRWVPQAATPVVQEHSAA